MPGIEIPEGYWTIRPAGFASSIGRFTDQFPTIAGDVLSGAAPVLSGNDAQLRSELATADGDADAIKAAAATNRAALDTTPTDAALAALGIADVKTQVGDANDATAAGYVLPGLTIPDPPSIQDQPPSLPGGTEPPPPDPNAPPAPIIAQLDALYMELLGRHIDDGGLANWMGEIALHGHTLDWVREQIIASPEYQALHSGASPPPSAPPPSETPSAPPPSDTSDYVTRAELQQVMDHFETTITLVV